MNLVTSKSERSAIPRSKVLRMNQQADKRNRDDERAGASFIAFVEKVRARPWLKRLIYAKWSVHTWDIEANALNNLGNTFVEKCELQQAVGRYEEALAVDPDYGAPYANLAVIGYDRGEEAEAARLLDRAHALGNRDLTQVAARERGNILRSIG
jgi:tetratricopeptide (TPR) repeat protein